MKKKNRVALETHSSLATPEGNIEFLLRRSKRRTMTIAIDQKAQIKVSVPLFLLEQEIHRFIHSKAGWIFQKVREIQENQSSITQKAFEQDHEFLFLGKKYKLNIIEQEISRPKIIFDGITWSVFISNNLSNEKKEEHIRKYFFSWYRTQAEEILGGRIFHFSRIMGVAPQKISIRTQKRIWGSCHPRTQSINLNWQIIMAPIAAIDYVVVHELAHLTHANHSKRFWKRVEKFLPDFKERQQWFKKNFLDMALP